MTKNSQKFIFLAAILIIGVFARLWYASLVGYLSHAKNVSGASGIADVADAVTSHLVVVPSMGMGAGRISSADGSLPASSPSASQSGASLASSEAAAGASAGQGAYFGEGNPSATAFSRVARTAVPDFASTAFLVADPTTGADIAQSHADARWPTASLTKLMTATVAIDRLSLDARITITPQMFAVDPAERTLAVNGTYSVSDLLHVMLMPSSNVAAEALADYYGHDKFMAEMNARAAQWGMADTYFDDPSGLSSANESTAHDLALLAEHAYRDYPAVLSYTDTPSIVITDLQSGEKSIVRSINQFAGEGDFIGGKTGATPEARDNLVSLFRYNGKPVLIIVLGALDASERFGDTTKLLNWFTMNYR